jgi:ubiquinone biosynthesis protein UbiJ
MSMLIGTLENILNRGLPRSVRARQLCAELAGRRLAIEAPALARVLIGSTGSSLSVSRGAGSADAQIIGGPLSLAVLSGGFSAGPLRRGEIEIRGDAEVAQKFQELLRLLSPDPEEELSLLIGDASAHRVGRLARGTLAWSRKAATTLLRDLGEYASHERGDLVPRQEGEQFLRGVDTLREDVDRFEARLTLLQKASDTK